jgi:hypothetical protein
LTAAALLEAADVVDTVGVVATDLAAPLFMDMEGEVFLLGTALALTFATA